MHLRGQLTKFHQVSANERDWQDYASVADELAPTDLDASRSEGVVLVPDSLEQAVDDNHDNLLDQLSDSGAEQRAWFYVSGKDELGPIAESEMVQMLQSGDIGPRTIVWSEGMGDWIPLKDTSLPKCLDAHTQGTEAAPSEDRGLNGNRGRAYLLWGSVTGVVVIVVVGLVYWAMNVPVDENAPPVGPVPTNGDVIANVTDPEAIANAAGLVVVGASGTNYEGRLAEFPMASGSAFAVGSGGEMITNKHVVEPYRRLQRASQLKADIRREYRLEIEEKLWVFVNGKKHPAEIIWVSLKHDVAIIKIDRQFNRRFALSAADRGLLDQEVRAIGFPVIAGTALSESEAALDELKNQAKLEDPPEDVSEYFTDRDYRFTLTDGRISQIASDTATGADWVQHTATISGGSSGGPLVTTSGMVLGINTSIASTATASVTTFRSLAIKQFRQDIDEHVSDAIWRE